MHPTAVQAVFLASAFAFVAASGCVGNDEGASGGGDDPSAGTGTGPSDTRTPRTGPPGSKAHVHDQWYGADSLLLYEDTVPLLVWHNHLFDEPPREQHTHGCDETLASDSQGGSAKFTLPPGNTVVPGTHTIEFAAEWDDPTITGIRLFYRPAGRGHTADHGHAALGAGVSRESAAERSGAPDGYDDGGILQSGEPVSIKVDPWQVDDGHALLSHWGFFLCAAGDPAALAQGKVQVQMVAHRAKGLPLDRPHPDHWGDTTRIRLGGAEYDGVGATAWNKGEGVWLQIPFDEHRVVAPGTAQVTVSLSFEDRSPLASLDLSAFVLYWRDPTQPDWVYQKVPTGRNETGAPGFIVTVPEDAVDSVYATMTDWDIWVRIRSQQHAETPVGDASAPHAFDGTLAVEMWAERGVA